MKRVSIYNYYSSIVPSEMSASELIGLCGDLQIAKNHGLTSARVYITSTKLEYDVPTADLENYRQQLSNSSCKCSIPSPKMKVSENGTTAYCASCSKNYLN